MKPFLRYLLWAAALIAVFFLGFGIFHLLHLEDAKLHAEVSQSSTSVLIKNVETLDWTQCVATLQQASPGKAYKSGGFDVAAGQEHSVLLSEFTADDGQHFDPLLHVAREVDLRCGAAGHYRMGQYGRK